MLAEVYEAAITDAADAGRFMNVSSRAVVSGGTALIGGVVLKGSGGNAPARARRWTGLAQWHCRPARRSVVAIYDAQGGRIAIGRDWTTNAADYRLRRSNWVPLRSTPQAETPH